MTLGRILVFLTVVSGLTFGLHYYFWARLVRDTALPQPWARLATVGLIALAVSIPTAFVLGRVLNRPLAGLSWIAFSWMGGLFLLFVALLVADLLRGSGVLVHGLAGGALDPERRQFLARVFAGGASAAAAAAGAAAVYSALSPVKVKEVRVTLAKLPRGLDGTRIVAISDVHLGPTIGRNFMADVVARINALKPDVVAIVGDLVDGPVEELRDAAAPLADLRARLGTFFVTGNHEYYSGAPEWIAHLRTLGIRPLENAHVTLGEGEARLELAGTHDLAGRAFGMGHDLDRALEGRDDRLPLVLLSHQPKTFPESAQKGVDLQISGHTHGGQLWPWGFLVKLQQGFLAGLSRVGAAQLYVSRGTGYWGPPMRLGAPAEITQIVLQAG